MAIGGQVTALLLATGLLAGCASEPSLRAGPEQGFAEARRLLVDRASAGMVPLELRGDPGMSETTVGEIAARGIGGAAIRFTGSVDRTQQRLLLAFDPAQTEAARACVGPVPTADLVPDAPRRLLAVFCDGSRAVAEVNATASGPALTDTQRMIWRATSRLFPDDWENSYGLGLFDRLGISLGGSSGF